jgi:hypothetical protein
LQFDGLAGNNVLTAVLIFLEDEIFIFNLVLIFIDEFCQSAAAGVAVSYQKDHLLAVWDHFPSVHCFT